MSELHPSVLREYDIRGVVGSTLSPEDAYQIARAFATIVAGRGGNTVCVGYDGRTSSPGFETAAVDGLKAGGLKVLRIGLGPTPMLYFAVYRARAGAGLMVTGSHNPPDYNGFKMMIGPSAEGPSAFYGADVQALGDLVRAGDFASGAGSVEDLPVFDDYVDALVGEAGECGGLTVAWDAGNGAAGDVVSALTARLPGRHVALYADIDGSFPNHHPDPTVAANLAPLQAAVAAQSCDLGVAFDGDGDRLGAVDGRGRILWADQLLVLFARDILARHPGAHIIADVKASNVLFDEIARAGGTPVMYKTGHSLIKARMRELNAPLAGEMSGHIFFADRTEGYDDGLYAAARLLRILSETGTRLDAFVDALPAVANTPELRFACPAERKLTVIDEVRSRVEARGAEVNAIDGVRVTTEDGWWLLRASNTQDVLVARCEGRDAAALERLKADLGEQLSAAGLTLPD